MNAATYQPNLVDPEVGKALEAIVSAVEVLERHHPGTEQKCEDFIEFLMERFPGVAEGFLDGPQ